MTKPATQKMTPGGIDSHRPMGSAWPVDPRTVSALPAFQMYARQEHDTDVDGTLALLQDQGPTLLDAYEAWHTDQGLWPNETPYGQLRD